MLRSFPFPVAARSVKGFLAGVVLLSTALVLALAFEVVALATLAAFFDLGAALVTSSTAAVVCFFMFYLG
ncbi:hypothetical protein [Pontibacter fetidus]|uniref:Uncharacterized protein n=1 Tax=Pontibacter fetidus TaxID=2700082 RepID=A0A6B2H8N6_9BACT|nr:hypothetical protein [Pontibacter fetidus]NDK56430.1 hypothetical protein [Pontibacter fetidus]